jgi:hypothetical protein
MRPAIHKRRMLNYCLATALVLAQVVGFLALPRPVAAEVSADPSAEIVYIDDKEFIRVLDTQGDPLVEWVSPDGGWDDIVLADVNDDGDFEIVAMDKQGDTAFRISVFDPVVTRGATDPNKQFNGIPWDTLWTTTIQGNGQYLVAGNFDNGIPGDEFVTGFRVGDTSIVTIWNANSLGSDGKPTGRDWKKHIEKEYPDYEYTGGVAGQLNGEGADELILFDPESDITRMDVYSPDNDLALLDSETSSNDRFKQGATGQLRADGNEELAAILTVSSPTRTSLRTYEMDDSNEVQEEELWAFAPQPDWLFLADISGNGDKELFFLRNYPEGSEGARLIMRDAWGDDNKRNEGLIEWALMDDGDQNQFRAGAGGDVDGDGKDEVILLRDDRIRIYHRPENGHEEAADYNDYMLATNNRRNTLLAGDLDRNGFSSGPVLAADKVLIDAIIPAGTASPEFTVQVSNIGTPAGVGVNVILTPGQSWAQIIGPTFVTTPATIRVRFDATALNTGSYGAVMRLVSPQADVQNNDIGVELRLTVVPPTLEPVPPVLAIHRLPAEQTTDPFTTTVQIRGSNDLSFRAAILGVPAAPSGSATVASGGLSGAITGGEIDAAGNIVIYDDQGNSRTLDADLVSAAQAVTTTVMLDPTIGWITGATLDEATTPAVLSIAINPSIMTEDYQREHAVLILVADTRAGTPPQNVTIVPIELANISNLMWVSFLNKE